MRDTTTRAQRQLDRLLDAGILTWAVAIELAGIQEGDGFYLTPNNEPFWYGGIQWSPWPIKVAAIADSGDGDLPTSQITLSNVGELVMAYLEDGSWDQARITLTLVYLPQADLELGVRFPFHASGAVANHGAVTISLGPANWLDRPFPPDRFIRSERFPSLHRNAN